MRRQMHEHALDDANRIEIAIRGSGVGSQPHPHPQPSRRRSISCTRTSSEIEFACHSPPPILPPQHAVIKVSGPVEHWWCYWPRSTGCLLGHAATAADLCPAATTPPPTLPSIRLEGRPALRWPSLLNPHPNPHPNPNPNRTPHAHFNFRNCTLPPRAATQDGGWSATHLPPEHSTCLILSEICVYFPIVGVSPAPTPALELCGFLWGAGFWTPNCLLFFASGLKSTSVKIAIKIIQFVLQMLLLIP